MLEKFYNVPTSSWWMAESTHSKVGISFVELATDQLTEEMVQKVENACNEAIRNHFEVNVKVFEKGDQALELSKTRGLPEDVTGRIRVIEMIDDQGEVLDSNMCCGTHVKNLSHLQTVKLLHWEKAKKNGHHNLYFLVGDRVIKYLETCYNRERVLNTVLSIGPDEHVKVCEKITKTAKSATKKVQNLSKEIASVDAKHIIEQKLKYFCIHRQDVDIDYINHIIRETNDPNILLVVGVGEIQTGGQLAIFGPEQVLKSISKE